MSLKKLSAGALIAVGAFALAAALAAAKVETRSNSTTIASHQTGSTTAKCPKGSEAVAGGFASPGFDPTFMGPAILDVASTRAGQRRWRTRGFNFGGPVVLPKDKRGVATTTGKLIGFTYCNADKPGLKVESGSASVPPFANGSATAKCPSGSEAVSGGFASPGDPGTEGNVAFPFTSKRVGDDKWRVVGFNSDETDPEKLVAFAYCDKHGPRLKTESKHVVVPGKQKRSTTANCGHGDKAYSGGYAAELDVHRNGAFTFTSKRTNGGDWTAAAEGSRNGGQLTVFAYCKT
jgi:hypothetical protein